MKPFKFRQNMNRITETTRTYDMVVDDYTPKAVTLARSNLKGICLHGGQQVSRVEEIDNKLRLTVPYEFDKTLIHITLNDDGTRHSVIA